MGVRRKSRARIAAVEKAGAIISCGVSPVAAKALVRADQHRVGQMLITDLVFDFGTSKQTLSTQATAANTPIGIAPASATEDSYLAHLTTAVFGVVTTVETVVLEQITDGTLTDFDLAYGTDASDPKGADGYLGNAPTNVATISEALNTNLGEHTITRYDNNVLASNGGVYLYLTAGDKTTKRASCTIDVSGVSDVATVISGMTAFQLKAADGTTPVNFVADSGTAFGSTSTGKFGIGSVDNTAKLSEGIARGINNHANFTASPLDGTSTTITVTRDITTPTTAENSANILVDGYTASGITITDFSGGIPNALTAGKLLIRLTGHVAPDDL